MRYFYADLPMKILMNQTLENEKQIISYLFGELNGAQRDELEEMLFLDEDFSLFVNNVENDLIDEYLRGELAAGEKQRFENAFLTSESRREKVRAAQVLQQKLFDENDEGFVTSTEIKASLWQTLADFFRLPNLALAGSLAAILLVLFGGIWLINHQPIERAEIDNQNQPSFTPTQVSTPQTASPVEENLSNVNTALDENKNLENKNSLPENRKPGKSDDAPTKPGANKPEKNQSPQTAPPSQRIFAFTLLPPLRSSKRPVLKLPSDAEIVRFQLYDNFGEKYDKYLVELNDGGGKRIWSQKIDADSKKHPQKLITVNVPGEKFNAGSYEFAVSGITSEGSFEEISFYNFVVQKN